MPGHWPCHPTASGWLLCLGGWYVAIWDARDRQTFIRLDHDNPADQVAFTPGRQVGHYLRPDRPRLPLGPRRPDAEEVIAAAASVGITTIHLNIVNISPVQVWPELGVCPCALASLHSCDAQGDFRIVCLPAGPRAQRE